MNVVVLIVSLALYPWLPHVKAGEYQTEYDCVKAAEELRQTTVLELSATCAVKT